jgi:urea transport system substrate-binding protein
VLALAVLAVGLAGVGLYRHYFSTPEPDSPPTPAPAAETEPIKFGLLFSLSGPLRDTGRSAIDAAQLAIRELNDKGGVLGRKVQWVIKDGKSDPSVFREQAEILLREDVCAILGCWTSAARRAVVPVIENRDSLLLYPVQYEGLEQSRYVFYLGATPNQQILPAIRTVLGSLGKRRLFLIGTDSVYPRAVHEMIKNVVAREPGAKVVGEVYLPPGSLDVAEAIKEIRASKADFIVDSLNGDEELTFPRELRKAGITPAQAPILFFNIPEYELRGRNGGSVVGDYVACNYFESIKTEKNRDFKEQFHTQVDPNRAISDTMENCYAGVFLWAKAVEKAGTTDPPQVRQALRGLEIEAPAGTLRIDPETQHTFNVVRLARIGRGGQLDIISSTEQALRPVPYPPPRSRQEWDKFLEDLYKGWGGHWEAPPP